MKTIAVVQSRYGSARLRGKAVKQIAGRPMLAHVLTRAKAIRGIGMVVLATSDKDQDTTLTWVADECDVPVIRGCEHDVLERFCLAAAAFDADVIMRITGDCPLLAPDVCERVLRAYVNDAVDLGFGVGPFVEFVSNDTTCSGFPDGMDCEVFSRRLLYAAQSAVPRLNGRRSDENADTRDREHVTTWMRRTQPQRVIDADDDWRHVKLSVDCDDDLERVRRIFGFVRDDDLSLAATMAAWKLACTD